MNEAMEVSTFTDTNKAGVSIMAEPAVNDEHTHEEATPNAPNVSTEEQGEASSPSSEESKQEQQAADIPAPQTQEAAQNTLKGVGLDIAEFENEFMANGVLSDQSYKKLSDAGIPKAMVDSYIKGQEAIAQKFIDDVHTIAGGTDAYASMSQWAAQNVPQDELVAFNHVMSSGKKDLITMAVTGMTARWKAAVGSAPKLTQGRVSTPSRVQGYASSAEMVKAMQDKRYGKDPAYTRAVEDRVARSKIFG